MNGQTRVAMARLALPLLVAWACSGSRGSSNPTQPRPDDEDLQPEVSATDPTALANGETFDVRIFGSGFDTGSQVSFAVGGQVSAFLRVEETRFRSENELVAVVAAAEDAPLDEYDVLVFDTRGRQGIGTELVEVVNSFVVDLGTLGGFTSAALGINEPGQVVGVSTLASGSRRAFLWTPGSGMVDLGALGAASSHANDLNDAGVIVGRIDFPPGDSRGLRAALWTASEQGRELGTLGGRFSEAQAINDAGQIVGVSETLTGDVHAFLWQQDQMLDLGTLGGSRSEARDINRSGTVVGESRDAAGVARAFIWDASAGMRELTAVGGDSSSAYAVNTAGEVAGWRAVNGRCQAFVLTSTGLRELQRPADECSGIAFGISDASVAVGESQACCRVAAIAWNPSGRSIGLDEGRAWDVNTTGRVVGESGGEARLWRIQ